MKVKRAIVYVDGFNLYFGMHDKGWRRYYWLDLWRLGNRLLKPDQKLMSVKYFTSKIKGPLDKRKRQNEYLRALRITSGVELYFGKYETNPITCENCGHIIEMAQEKMTDVQLATCMIADAFKDKFDVALIISGDRDLVPAVERCKAEVPSKRIVVVFPPMRSCGDLRYAAHAYIHITESTLQSSLFPTTFCDNLGRSIECPREWA